MVWCDEGEKLGVSVTKVVECMYEPPKIVFHTTHRFGRVSAQLQFSLRTSSGETLFTSPKTEIIANPHEPHGNIIYTIISSRHGLY